MVRLTADRYYAVVTMRPESEDADPRDAEYQVAIVYDQDMLPPRRSIGDEGLLAPTLMTCPFSIYRWLCQSVESVREPRRRSRRLIAKQWGRIPRAPTPEKRRRQGGPLS